MSIKDLESQVVKTIEVLKELKCLGCNEKADGTLKFTYFTATEIMCTDCLSKLWNAIGKYFVVGGGIDGKPLYKSNCTHIVSASFHSDTQKLICDNCGDEVFYD